MKIRNIAATAVSAAAPSAAIPYRVAPPVPAIGLGSAIVLTALIMTALVGFAVYARRRGWLAAGAGNGSRANSDSDIQILATRRLSLATTMHMVRCGGCHYLLVESTRGKTAVISAMHEPGAGQGKPS